MLKSQRCNNYGIQFHVKQTSDHHFTENKLQFANQDVLNFFKLLPELRGS